MSIQVKNVTKFFGNQAALNDVSFEIGNNEIVGFIGPNGAGKSTMMKTICGLLEADKGSVHVNGMDVLEKGQEVKKQLGFLPESNPLYFDMYVREYLEFIARLHQLKLARDTIERTIQKTGLAREVHKKIGVLSKGYKQRVGLAQALLADPSVLILDEPTSGLDPNQIIEIRNLIAETANDKTVLLSTHLMQEVEAICERVILIDNGRIIADGKTAEIGMKPGKQQQTVRVEFMHAVNPEKWNGLTWIKHIKQLNTNEWLIEGHGQEDIRPNIFNLAVEWNNGVLNLQKENRKLEEVFQELTRDSNA